MSENIPATVSVVTEDMLAQVQSFDDAMRIVNDVFGGQVVEADKAMGTGFGVADEKSPYVGQPFIVLKADRNDSDKGTLKRFWSLHCVTKSGTKVIINDGGTGIAAQMDALFDRHADLFDVTEKADENGESTQRVQMVKPLLVKKGLRVSHYTHPEHGEATTYYLDTSGVV